MNPTIPRIAELPAPAAWRVVDFISDLHLQASELATVAAWEHYMAHTRADAVLGLFEVWVGDDVLGITTPSTVRSALRAHSPRHGAALRRVLHA
jgi:UDP-2,3-diacylglucosamine pyrophosphatase LpxH